MKVKIWGARGSTPAPLGPDAVREKIISAILGITKIENNELREEFVSTILRQTDNAISGSDSPNQVNAGMYEQVHQKIQAKRRKMVEHYVDNISPLGGSTAGGNTPCIEIRAGNDLFIIDAGSGIRELGLELMKGPCGRGEGVIHLLFSHPHWDHIQGFPFFRPAFIPGNQINIYSIHDLETALRRQQDSISFPISLDYMQADMLFKPIERGQVLKFGDLRIRNIRTEHPGDAYGYRFEEGDRVFVYASDSAYPPGLDMRPYFNFFDEADVLIFDAQFTQRESDEKEDWGHSSSFVGVEMAQESHVKNLVLFHYDPTYSDQELEEILDRTLRFQRNQYPSKTPVNILIGQEGQVFDLVPSQSTEVQQIPGSQAVILKPCGVFDEFVALELREQLNAQSELPPQLIIDMAAVDMLQVAGLRALVKLRKEQQDSGISMVLVGPSDNVKQLIELAGYLDFFAIYDTIDTALNVLQSRETLNLPGQMLKGRYQIESKIGDGRLGTVFRAIDTKEDKAVAIKILSASFSEGAIEQFLRQAREIIEMIHPNVVNVYDCDQDQGIPFMAEEFIEGKTLQVLIEEMSDQSLPFDVALSIAGSITRALEYAHTKGVIHGDLKPENVLLADEVKVSDFGLGRLESGRALINIDVPLALVTARYLAPEQVLGHPIDARTDLYALGVILYELFTGRPPFDGPDREVLEQHRNQLPKPPRELNPNLSRSLEHLILKLLDKDPIKRYASAHQVGYILSSMSDAVSNEVQSHSFTIDRQPALAGREDLLQQLSELWLKTEQGEGQAVFIHGESGIGKTRLVYELIQRLDEATVLIGECQPLAQNTPYYPFISALKTYFGTVAPAIAAQSVGQVWQNTAQLIPEIVRLMPATSPLAYDKALYQVGTFSLAQSIAQETSEHPWLLVLDDLRWADQSSLALLKYLIQHCQGMALMIVAIYEDEAVTEQALLAHILENTAHYTDFSLAALTEVETQELLENIWSQAVPKEMVTTIYKHTQGNPLYIEEVSNGLVEKGIVNWRHNKWYFGSIAETHLPPNVDQAILRRIQGMSRETQTFLNQAAILGTAIKFTDLQEMSDLSSWDALESLDVTLQRQLLKEAPGEKIVRFRHPRIQQALYQGLSRLKRRLLHREAGEALERQHLPEPKENATALAYHFLQAGELTKGLIYSIQAARQAASIFALQAALYWYTQALDVITQLGLDNVTQQQRIELLLAHEQICHYQGARQMQANDLIALQKLVQTLDNPYWQAQVHCRQAAYDYAVGRINEAATEIRTGLIAARQAGHPALEAECLIQLAQLALHQGQLGQARDKFEAAMARVQAINEPIVEMTGRTGFGKLYKHLHHYLESEKHYQQTLTSSRQIGNWYGQANCMYHLGDLAFIKGDYMRAKSYQEQAYAINQMSGYRQGEANCLSRLAAIYKTLGCYDVARSYIEQAMSMHQEIEDKQGLGEDLCVWGAICRAMGDYKTARDLSGQALKIFQQSKNKLLQGQAWLEVALSLEGVDDYARAGQAYNQAQFLQMELDSATGSVDAKAGLARCLLVTGETDQAEAEIKTILNQTARDEVWFIQYPIYLYLTIYRVLEAVNKPSEALKALQQGQTLLQKQVVKIEDPVLQSTFLENVSENRELLAQLEQLEVKA